MTTKQPSNRASGILLHPTSFPGPGGIGSLGKEALKVIDQLAAAGQQVWQLLPLVPVGPGDSPYAGTSAFAGEPLLIDLADLVERGWLAASALHAEPDWSPQRVDYAAVREYKWPLLEAAWHGFQAHASKAEQKALAAFKTEHQAWLDDYALFVALKAQFGGEMWTTWPTKLVTRDAATLAEHRESLADAMALQAFCQYVFDLQWRRIRQAASAHGIRILGDIPIFVAYDSADVWAHQALFAVDAKGKATDVAGVPPDYFSPEGQLWGNPLYRWDVLAERGYDWWVARMRHALTLYDMVRLDHFRGFEAYWAVPATHTTAIKGRWLPGPGAALFEAIEAAVGHKLPVIAEDLGMITAKVLALRDALGFPGMKVLQFAFDEPENAYLPHNYTAACVVYTGTHDNNTTRGWFEDLSEAEQQAVQLYLGRDGHDIAWDLIRTALGSVADLAIIPMQDVLDLGTEGRMNQPGHGQGNWNWRLQAGQWTAFHQHRLRELTTIYGRLPAKVAAPKPSRV